MLMMALRYEASNPLNAVFVKYFSRLSAQQLDDYHALTTLYLSVFRPEDLCEVDVLLEKYEGSEDEMFHKLVSFQVLTQSFDSIMLLLCCSILTHFFLSAHAEYTGIEFSCY